ncbi:RNA polymerase sigma factor RpoH [Tistrella mobilis]|jgi:RNA polymerase sigma-32 factor|uniref:RNA polymerase sigma factor RpoH n=1 Tax=Tistrella mobilis TaxID=171437 RepID=UPI0035581E7E
MATRTPRTAGRDNMFDAGLGPYLQQIRRYPVLELEQEQRLARRFRDEGDVRAADQLVNSHLRLVAKIAMGYRGYGLPLADLISEGNLGMMQAVHRFDPDRGFRLATYAIWWIRAAIQEYIMRSWSVVRMGTTASQKRLFFNLRRVKSELDIMGEAGLNDDQVAIIAQKLDVEPSDVVAMERYLDGIASSLNEPVRQEADTEWQDWLESPEDDQETMLAEAEETGRARTLIEGAVASLGDRERDIFSRRRLVDAPATLEDLSQVYGISRERVRQIEARALEKVSRWVKRETRREMGRTPVLPAVAMHH